MVSAGTRAPGAQGHPPGKSGAELNTGSPHCFIVIGLPGLFPDAGSLWVGSRYEPASVGYAASAALGQSLIPRDMRTRGDNKG